MPLWVGFEVSKASCNLKFALSPSCLGLERVFFLGGGWCCHLNSCRSTVLHIFCPNTYLHLEKQSAWLQNSDRCKGDLLTSGPHVILLY